MKPLFSAILETIVLVVSTLIILLGTAIFKYESPYLNYSETHPDSTITLGEVLGYVSEETDTPKESAAEAAKKIFGKNTEKVLPLAVGKFLCIEVGERTASVLEFYTFIVFLESIICLIFGITLPCSLYRHLDPAKAIDNAFVNKNYVYVDNLGHTNGYVGETRAWLVKILLLFLMLFVANIWCTFLPIFIVINFAVGLVMAILRIVGITTSNAAAKAKMKLAAGKDTGCKYRVVVENDLFAVAGDVYPNRSLYFKKYWNAVVAQRILECDRDGRLYTNDDALNTITYGDENVHKQYKTIRRINKIKLLFSSASRKNAKKFKNENESRIRYLEKMIKTAVIVSEDSPEDEVGMNNTVDIYFEEDDVTETYKLVTTVRSNSLKNLISRESPLGAAIFGHKVGDRCEVHVNDNYSYFVQIKRIVNTMDDGTDELRKF